MEAPSLQCFKLDQTFFGFKPEHQVQLHDQLFELLWAGEGRCDWDTIYNLPIHIRRFWVTKLNKRTNEMQVNEQEAAERLKTKFEAQSKVTKLPN